MISCSPKTTADVTPAEFSVFRPFLKLRNVTLNMCKKFETFQVSSKICVNKEDTTECWYLQRVQGCFVIVIEILGSIHTEQKGMWKRKFSLMFENFSLISFDCSLIFVCFRVRFGQCEQAFKHWYQWQNFTPASYHHVLVVTDPYVTGTLCMWVTYLVSGSNTKQR